MEARTTTSARPVDLPAGQPADQPADQPEATTTALYQRSIIVDGSVAPRIDDAYVERLVASGVTAVNWTVCRPWAAFDEAVAEIADGLEVVARHADRLVLARTVADIETAKASGRVAVIFGPQNALPGEAGPHAFRVLHELGVRIIQLTYNERNAFGDGAAEASNAGLSRAGRRAVAEMDRLRIVVDLSHCGDRTTLEAIDASANPVLITHANSRSLHPSPRNKTDEALKALAARDGVVGVTLWSPMLRFDRWPDVEDYVRQVGHVADLIGLEHVGIGTDHSEGAAREDWEADFGAGGRYPTITGAMGPWYAYDTRFAEDATSIGDLPQVVEAIARLGLSDAELQGVLGGNFLRVFRQVWGG